MILPLWSYPIVATTLWIAWLLERKYPVDTVPLSEVLMDWKLALIRIGMDQLVAPLMSAAGIVVINGMDGGWIHLRADGWWFLSSVIVIVVVSDFLAYLIHVASHKIPVLWAMHSLHHSAEALSIITGARHFWLIDAIGTVAFWGIGVIFKIPAEIVPIVLLIHLVPCGLAHMNARLSLGKFTVILNNPQFHRIHHSIEPQHRDKNFCQILPLFDVIFGTAWKPETNEYPKTGLFPNDRATSLDGFIWPFRKARWARTIKGQQTGASGLAT